MKQTLLLLAGVTLLIVLLGVLHKYPQEASNALQNPGLYLSKTAQTTIGNKKTIKVGDKEILVEVADTDAKRQKGLADRKTLGDSEGIFFIFTRKDFQPAFWMKGMLMPIDIIWINDSKIAQIDANIQPPTEGTPDKDLPLIIPKNPIDYVLEVNTGFSERNKLEVGTPIDLTNIEK